MSVTPALRKFFAWFWLHFDIALLLAAAVEVPRWTVTFLAIHEPFWVGVPLGMLLAYATAEGWRAYFAKPRRIVLLAFNVVSLAAAIFVITPVLYSMASAPIAEIDLAQILPPLWLATWSAVLAVTTFAPLIQLAAVKSVPTPKPIEPNPAETKRVNTLANGATTIAVVETSAEKRIDAPSNAPSPSTANVEVLPVVATARKTKRKPSAKLTPAQRRAQIASAGLLDPAQIVSQFAVSARTAQADLAALRKATTKTNGVHA